MVSFVFFVSRSDMVKRTFKIESNALPDNFKYFMALINNSSASISSLQNFFTIEVFICELL